MVWKKRPQTFKKHIDLQSQAIYVDKKNSKEVYIFLKTVEVEVILNK